MKVMLMLVFDMNNKCSNFFLVDFFPFLWILPEHNKKYVFLNTDV